jgi:hypothetical protein
MPGIDIFNYTLYCILRVGCQNCFGHQSDQDPDKRRDGDRTSRKNKAAMTCGALACQEALQLQVIAANHRLRASLSSRREKLTLLRMRRIGQGHRGSVAVLCSIMQFLAAVTSATVCLAASPNNLVLPVSGLVAEWQGDGDGLDAVAGHNGQPDQDVRYALAPGGRGFLFSGHSGGVFIPDSPAFGLSSLTLAAWVKVDSAQPSMEHQILFRGDTRPGLDPWSIEVVGTPEGQALCRFTLEQAAPSGSVSVSIEAPVTLGRFLRIAATFDGNSGAMRLFIGGELAAQKHTDVRPLTSLDPTATPGLGIGNTEVARAINEPFEGVISDVRLYSRALAAAEISAISQTPTVPQAPAQLLSKTIGTESKATGTDSGPHRYWPLFPRPKTVVRATLPPTEAEAAVLQTLAGVVARAGTEGQTTEMIWIDSSHPAYPVWRQRMQEQTHAALIGPFNTWNMVDRYVRLGVVKGYVLFHFDDSARGIHQSGSLDPSLNVATVLCAGLHAIAVPDTEEQTARQHGLTRLQDARGITEQECFDRYHDQCSRDLVALIDPKVATMRDEAVAAQAFVLSQPGPLYDQVLAWLHPDSPVIGWSIGDERGVTMPSTQQAAFQTDTDWCQNLPALSTEAAGSAFPTTALRRPPASTLWDVPWEDNVHYATFVMSDGDNIQWGMGDFAFATEGSWWGSPARGTMPLGWTCCFDGISQVCPYLDQYLFQTAKPGDDFILFGGGYYYPDYFGTKRTDHGLLAQHASRLAQYMQLGGLNLLMFNFQDWASQAGVDALSTYAQTVPGLLGMFAINYDSYTSGGGLMRWIPDGGGGEVPAVSVRFGIWNHSNLSGQGDPAKVAALLNAMPHEGHPTTSDFYSTVVVHCWSWFHPPSAGHAPGSEEVDQNAGGTGDTARGMLPAQWCAQQLQPYVRVVTPTQLMLLLRLRAHPQPTLQQALADLTSDWHRRQDMAQTPAARKELEPSKASLHAALRALDASDYRLAWQNGVAAHRQLESERPPNRL